ncbi:MAG: hypothetical protein M0O99_02735 [Desulfuromonas thiophila]|jgi:hypothetical protein|nr:hypothetical protein [Desulfuromonas thiophila]
MSCKATSCLKCRFLEPAPKNSCYADAYGWCHAPKPFYVDQCTPLVTKKERKGTPCATFQPGKLED